MIVNYNDLEKIKGSHKGHKIVLTIGSFDLFHYEHLRYLQDAKKLGDILVVVVKSDEVVRQKSKDRPIITDDQRIFIVDALACVDYCVMCNTLAKEDEIINLFGENLDAKTLEWLKNFWPIINKLKPNILYHEDSSSLQKARELVSQKLGLKLISRHRTAIISTTKIIDKIIKISQGN